MKLKYSTEEKSISSAFFFCIRAVPNPFTTKTFASAKKTFTSAICPYCSGINNLANTIDTTNETPSVQNISLNFQNKPDTTDFLSTDSLNVYPSFDSLLINVVPKLIKSTTFPWLFNNFSDIPLFLNF